MSFMQSSWPIPGEMSPHNLLTGSFLGSSFRGCSHPGGGSWNRVSACTDFSSRYWYLDQRKALPFPWAWLGVGVAIPMDLRHWSCWDECVQFNNTHSLRTSSSPRRMSRARLAITTKLWRCPCQCTYLKKALKGIEKVCTRWPPSHWFLLVTLRYPEPI